MPAVADAAVQILLQLVFCQAGIRKKRIKWCAVHVPIADAIFRRFTASSYSDDPFKNVVAYKLADDAALNRTVNVALKRWVHLRARLAHLNGLLPAHDLLGPHRADADQYSFTHALSPSSGASGSGIQWVTPQSTGLLYTSSGLNCLFSHQPSGM